MATNPKIQPRLLPEMHAYLQDLLDTGAYGKTPSDVARTLIEEGVRRALAEKIIRVRPKGRADRAIGRLDGDLPKIEPAILRVFDCPQEAARFLPARQSPGSAGE